MPFQDLFEQKKTQKKERQFERLILNKIDFFMDIQSTEKCTANLLHFNLKLNS